MQRTFGLALAIFLFACGGPDARTSSAPTAPPSPGAPAATAEPPASIVIPTSTPSCPDLPTELAALELPAQGALTLLTPGAEPRHELRYRPTLGAHASVVFRQDTDMSITPAKGAAMELASPRIVMTLVTDVVDVRDDDTFVIRRVADQVVLEDRDGVTPKSRENVERAMEGSTCMVVEEHVDARGVVLGVRSSGRDLTADGLRLVLPAEPVGKGATWEVRGTRLHAGFELGFVTTYELLSSHGNEAHVTAKSDLTLAVAPGADRKVEIVGSTGQQSFTSHADLVTLAPMGSGSLTLVYDTRDGKRRYQHVMSSTSWFGPE